MVTGICDAYAFATNIPLYFEAILLSDFRREGRLTIRDCSAMFWVACVGWCMVPRVAVAGKRHS